MALGLVRSNTTFAMWTSARGGLETRQFTFLRRVAVVGLTDPVSGYPPGVARGVVELG